MTHALLSGSHPHRHVPRMKQLVFLAGKRSGENFDAFKKRVIEDLRRRGFFAQSEGRESKALIRRTNDDASHGH